MDPKDQFTKDFESGKYKDQYLPDKCSECKRLGELCQTPRPFADWKIGLVSEEEY